VLRARNGVRLYGSLGEYHCACHPGAL